MPKTTPERPRLDLDAVLASRAPAFTLGGLTFDGRPIGWTVALGFDSKKPTEQLETVIDALRARTEDPELMTDEWLEEHLTRPALDLVVGILFRGERPTT